MDQIVDVKQDWESYLENCKNKYYFFNKEVVGYSHCALQYVCIENTYKFLHRKLDSGRYKVVYVGRANLG